MNSNDKIFQILDEMRKGQQKLEKDLSELKSKVATKSDVRIEITKAKDEFVDILKKEAESTADLFSETWRRYDKTTERITLIEEEIEIMKVKN